MFRHRGYAPSAEDQAIRMDECFADKWAATLCRGATAVSIAIPKSPESGTANQTLNNGGG